MEHRKAKKGDIESAIKLVKGVVKRDRIVNFAKEYPNALVVPVIAEEKARLNTIPYVYAILIEKVGGLKIEKGITQINKVYHTGAS